MLVTIVVAAAAAMTFRCQLGGTCSPQVALVAKLKQVRHWPAGQTEQVVLPGTQQAVQAGDRIDVDQGGEALLRFPDFLEARIFRDSTLAINVENKLAADAPPVYSIRLESGALLASANSQSATSPRLKISTQWAEIEHIGTTFFVYVNPKSQKTWVVVREGRVRVSDPRASGSGSGKQVLVDAGKLTSIEPGQPPSQPQPATRAAVGSELPLIDSLTNNTVADSQLLLPAVIPATLTPTSTPVGDSTPITSTVALAPPTLATTPSAVPSETPAGDQAVVVPPTATDTPTPSANRHVNA
jgi:hypothetical protein